MRAAGYISFGRGLVDGSIADFKPFPILFAVFAALNIAALSQCSDVSPKLPKAIKDLLKLNTPAAKKGKAPAPAASASTRVPASPARRSERLSQE